MFSALASSQKCRHEPVRQRRWHYPARSLHLIDVENLTGSGLPTHDQVGAVRASYSQRVGLGPADLVVIACSHRNLADLALGWPNARYRIRSGPDGADLELLDVIDHENVAERFTHVVIGSGDGIFADAAASLAAASRWVTAVSRRESLSARLRLAACDVIYLNTMEPVSSVVSLQRTVAA